MWTGDTNSVFKTLGASNLAEETRQVQDYYATEPAAVELLLAEEQFSKNVWECACGEGHMAEVLKGHGHNVRATDVVDRGYGGVRDFLFFNCDSFNGDIVTNPPYKKAQEFTEKALELVPRGGKVAMFLKLQFLEGKRRKLLFKKNPPKTLYVSSSRLLCAKNGDFDKARTELGAGAVAYAWFVWQKNYMGKTNIKWIN